MTIQMEDGGLKKPQFDNGGEAEMNDNPIEEVRLTIPVTDDPTLPVLTFRTWFLGIISCALLAFVNQFFGYRQNQLSIGSMSAQILVLPVGKLMAATLPTRKFRLPLTPKAWEFTLNPGPFNIKEHVLISTFATSGAAGVYAVHINTIVKAFYHRSVHPLAGLLLAQTTQLLGYGWAGLFRKYLVDSPYMWWPLNLVSVALFRALHDNEARPKRGLTRLQFFFMIFVASFVYYLVPSYLFPTISSISIACFIWKNSITAQQIGSGLHGLGIGSFGIDWSTVASFLGTPLATPLFAIANILVGFVLIVYVMTPVAYWGNAYDAKKFPIITSRTFDHDGNVYNITRILKTETFEFDEVGYRSYSKLYLSIFFAITYGLNFATLTATISHVALFDGKTIMELWRKTASASSTGKLGDIHTRLMKRNYREVPQWWFQAILVLVFGLALLTVEGFGKQFQLPWWGLLLSSGIALFFTLPIGIIMATTNQQPGLNVITELIIGYLYPGRPLANVCFKTYGYISMTQALYFLQDLKFGHYMKIPPRSMFAAQLVGTIVASTVYFSTAWWLLTTIPNICDPDNLPEGSPWTCPGDTVFYNASIIWGIVGPLRMFTSHGIYPGINWFFLAGALAPIPGYVLGRMFPQKKWLKLIHMPIILSATSTMPPTRSVNYIMWGAVGIFFNYYVYRKYKSWWARHNYILSAALDAGLAFMAVLLWFALQSKDINGPDWWGLLADDHCPLAKCPTAPGIKVKGCPVL